VTKLDLKPADGSGPTAELKVDWSGVDAPKIGFPVQANVRLQKKDDVLVVPKVRSRCRTCKRRTRLDERPESARLSDRTWWLRARTVVQDFGRRQRV